MFPIGVAEKPDPDAGAFADHDIASWIARAPESARAAVEREMIRRGGLRKFVPLAWHTCEGSVYQGGWHVDAVMDHMQALVLGHIDRLMLMIPPRHMKSMACAVMAPAWSWTVDPSLSWLFASYAFNLAVRDSRKCRMVIKSRWYQTLYRDLFSLEKDQNAKTRFANDHHGSRLSTSVRGQLTGEGADIIVVDDPHNVLEAESQKKREETILWWDEAMSSRLNNQKTGRRCLIQQRVHENDLAGHALARDREAEQEFRENWVTLCLPAEFEPDHPQRWFRDPRKEPGELLWPERFGRREIGRLKMGLGPYASAAQLQQRPAPREGGFFKRSWFKPWLKPVPLDMAWVRGWDLASSVKKSTKSDPDWTAGVLIGWSPSMRLWIIGHALRDRLDSGDVRRLIRDTAEADLATYGGEAVRIDVPQDPGAGGKAQAQDLVKYLAPFRVSCQPVQGDKGVRAEPLAAQAQNGNVHYLNRTADLEQGWWEPFIKELTGFPAGSHDDFVDAASSAFLALTGGRKGILDYYADDLVARAEEDAAAAERLARGPTPSYGVSSSRTSGVLGSVDGQDDADFED